MLPNFQYSIVVLFYVIISTDAINCKGCVPLDIFTFDKVGHYTANRYFNVLTYSEK
jgi:hypothetical protein